MSWSLFRVMIPTLIVVKIAQEFGFIDVLNVICIPVTNFIGLPEEAAIVLTTTMLTSPYTGLMVFASIEFSNGFSVAQSTILACFMLFAHSLPVEAAISRQAGASAVFVVFVRISSAICFCFLVNQLLSSFGLLQASASFILPELNKNLTLAVWLVEQIKGILFIQLVIVILLFFLELIEKMGIEKFMYLIVRPFLKLIGIGESGSRVVIVGLTLGLSFGGGLMIKAVKDGSVCKEEILKALIFINLFHSVFEDTAIIMLLSPSIFIIVFCRFFFVMATVYLIIKGFSFVPKRIRNAITLNPKVFKKNQKKV